MTTSDYKGYFGYSVSI